MLTLTIFFILGLILLVGGAHLLVEGGVGLARTFKVSSLFIGLTIVAFGTSTPEVAVSTVASWQGDNDLAVGNVVGSNIFNVLFILGVSALITPLIVHKQLIYWDVPIMIAVSLVLWLIGWSGALTLPYAVLFLLALVAYTYFAYRMGKKEGGLPTDKHPKRPLWRNIAYVILGLALLWKGADFLVDSAKTLALALGISELIIGLTIVAAGTSLPEVATSIVAALRNQRDIAVGNVIGSNIFNTLGVLGIAGLFSSEGLTISTKLTHFDIPVMVGVALACLPIFWPGHRISRWEGGVFLFYYVLYLTYLYLQEKHIATLPFFTSALLFFVFPLTLLTLGIKIIRELKYKNR